MSLERHPNFHAVKFATEICESFMKSLRGEAEGKKIWLPQEQIAKFVHEIEEYVDESLEKGKFS